MTSLIEPELATLVNDLNTLHKGIASDACYRDNRQRRHVLKSKENTYKHKCYKLLKNKLKKYKLRQDGIEDQDVVDVSKILVSSLVIKSPSNEQESFAEEGDWKHFEELRPKNYLFKMVRRKESSKISNSITNLKENFKCNDVVAKCGTTVNEAKKHTNAFQLLMDSRNKSIGTNSPGKDKNDDHTDTDEMVQQKCAKAKRNLLLHKMAESKGYQKNKELEEYHDKIIKKKMDKRAERLKAMILKESKKSQLSECNSELRETKDRKVTNSIQTKNSENIKKTKTFKIVDIFNTLNDPVSEHTDKKLISKEDNDFINKLSPSLKKTESVLSYFKKVDKESDICPIAVENDEAESKIKPKKKGGKKNLRLKKGLNLHELLEVNDNIEINRGDLKNPEIQLLENSEAKNANERQKRIRNAKAGKSDVVSSTIQTNNTDCRPKRSIKKPVKYTDDVYLSSSDEDLHIFTPKKKKKLISNINGSEEINLQQKEIIPEPVKPNNKIKKVKDTNTVKKASKLAPIFAAKPDSAALEAKQKFLQSGVPDKLKKIISQQNNNSKLSCEFSVVVHVQQSDAYAMVNQPLINVFESDINDNCHLVNEVNTFKKLLNLDETIVLKASDNIKSVKVVLQSIKQLYPKFPVYRTYHYLRNKGKGVYKDYQLDIDNSIEVMNDVSDFNCDSPERLSWTDKYKAISTSKIIGNFESVKELKKWLESWTENELKSRNKGNDGSDSDFYHSDTDSRESFKSMHNLLVLTGPTGCGKTSSVYAVAADLSMKVIEVNASSKRTGKIMLQDLQEATQSHKVNRGTSTDNSQKSQEKPLTAQLKKNRKRGRSKISTEKVSDKCSIPSSQESTRTDMSLILIDDADIVFEQDDGFSSAIVQLVHYSKRPVILITSSLTSPHLQKFLHNGKILKMCPLSPKLLGPWLDIMCLADSGICWPGDGAKFLNYFKGDIRKTINYLQFYISSYTGIITDEERGSQNIEIYKKNIDDENSSMSWAQNEDLEGKQLTPVNNVDMQPNAMWIDIDSNNSDVTKYIYPSNLLNIWWSVPQLLHFVPESIPIAKLENKSRKTQKALEAIADVLDAISLSDCVMGSRSYSTSDITSQPWYSPDSDSMSEQDNIDYYMHNYEIGSEISHTMISGCIVSAQNVLKCEQTKKISFPGMSLERQKNKVVSRHTSLTSYLNPWTILDRRSLSLDYWSSCRTICRIEKAKTDANMSGKRHNRFSHYLKSLSVLCSNDTFTDLCYSLSDEGNRLNI